MKGMARSKQRGHGEGSIYQRKDGRWVASITVEGRKRKTLYGKTRKEVAEKLHKALQDRRQGILPTWPRQKLGEYLEHWLEKVHKPGIRLTTYAGYRNVLDNHLLPGLGHIQLQGLTPQQVQAFYARELEDGLSPRTLVSMVHVVLHKALDDAYDGTLFLVTFVMRCRFLGFRWRAASGRLREIKLRNC